MKKRTLFLLLALCSALFGMAQDFKSNVPRCQAELLEVKIDGNDLVVRFRLNPNVNTTLFRVGSARYLLDPLHKWKRASIYGTGGRRGVDATSNYVNHGDYYFVRVTVKDIATKSRSVNSVEAEVKTSYGTGTLTIGYTSWDANGKIIIAANKASQSQNSAQTHASTTQQTQTTSAPQGGQLPADFVSNDDFLSKWRALEYKKEAYEAEPTLKFSSIVFFPNGFKKIYLNDYKTDYQFNDGILAVYNNEVGGWGFYDEDGNLLPGGFRWTKNILQGHNYKFSSGYCLVMRRESRQGSMFKFDEWYLLDKKGNARHLPFLEGASCAWAFNNGGIAAIKTAGLSMDAPVILVNTSGQRVFPNITLHEDDEPLGDFIDGWARIRVAGGYTYLNKSGQTIGKKFSKAQPFSDGLAAVLIDTSMGRRWGFIDANGSLVIPARYSNEPSPFSSGYAVVKKQNNKMVFINRRGEVCSPEADAYTNFVKGYAFGAAFENGKRVAWLVDSQMQRINFPNDVSHINGETVGYLARYLPVKTSFDGRYIQDVYSYGDWGAHVLYHPTTGYKLAGYRLDAVLGPTSMRRSHVEFARMSSSTPTRHFFVNEYGMIVLEIAKEEF